MKYFLSFVTTKIYRVIHSAFLFRFGFGARVGKGIWEKEYSDNKWDFLFDDNEKEHYREIIKQVKSYKGQAKILDIGCGHGALFSYINSILDVNFDYLGIDISEIAVKKALEKFPEANFKVIDYDFEKLDGQFNVVILNESLYYFIKPMKTLKKIIEQNLANGGIILVSMYQDAKNNHRLIWNEIDDHFKVVTAEIIKSKKGSIWTIKTIR